MSKLSPAEKGLFTNYKAELKAAKVTVCSIKKAGMTIGIQETNELMGNHVRIFVAQCSPNDAFKFKRGVIELFKKVHDGMYIVIPRLGREDMDIIDEVINFYGAVSWDLNTEDYRYL